MSDKSVLYILGPTATGKSKLALRTALVPQLPIINGDSIQIYKGLKIGSALPSREDLQLTPHHLYAYVEKGENYTASYFVEDVKKLLAEHKKQSRWIVCGGSGFYLQAIDKGMFSLPQSSPEIKRQVNQLIAEKGWEAIYKELLQRDPDLKKKIHLNDHYRIQRALEIQTLTEKNHGELHQEMVPGPFKTFSVFKVGLTSAKEKLREKVTRRVKEMLGSGFIEEVDGLLKEGLADWPALSSVGYKEVKEALTGGFSLSELPDRIVTSHMQLIKKQMTWFRRDSEIKWFDCDDATGAHEYIKSALKLD